MVVAEKVFNVVHQRRGSPLLRLRLNVVDSRLAGPPPPPPYPRPSDVLTSPTLIVASTTWIYPQMPNSQDVQTLYAQVRRRLIETGEWDQSVLPCAVSSATDAPSFLRIRGILAARLNESGWLDDVKGRSKGASH
mgnify:CR=1 FL=1